KGGGREGCPWWPVATAGTQAARGAATAGRDSPGSASRPRTRDPRGAGSIGSALGQRALEVGDQVLRVRARHDLDQLPSLLAVVVEDLLGRVDQQRNGQVLPAGDSAHGASLPGRAGGRATPALSRPRPP